VTVDPGVVRDDDVNSTLTIGLNRQHELSSEQKKEHHFRPKELMFGFCKSKKILTRNHGEVKYEIASVNLGYQLWKSNLG